MRKRAIQLTALTTCLLITGLGRAQLPPSDQADSKVTTGTADPTATGIAGALVPADEEAPPTSRPERGISAQETSPDAERTLPNRAVQGVVELLRAGVDEEVLLKHIQNSPDSFNIGSEEIVFLTDLGAPGHIISAMMDRDEETQPAQPPTASEPEPSEPWPAAGTVAEVPAAAGVSYASTPLPLEGQEVAAVEAPAEEIGVDYFYDYLAPYGTWIDVPEYGLCWQPTAAVSAPGWRPYGDRGRWIYTDYGWYWYSDYSWGWAAFHYGRWFHHTRWGWCWAPGTVWGPSWVSWRYSAPYCGWAPLPPYSRGGFYFSVGISWGIPSWCYTYVPSYRICSYYPRRHAIHHKDAHDIHGKSRIRNHYAVGRNHRIENLGIPPTDLTDNPDRDIQRARINKRHERPADSIRRERLDNDGQTLTIYEPRRSDRRAASPQTVSRAEPGARTRDTGVSSSPTRGGGADATRRRSSPNETHIATGTRDTTPAVARPDERRSNRPSNLSEVAPAATDREATTGGGRKESPVLERSVNRSAQPGSRAAAGGHLETGRKPATTASTRKDNSLIITGRRDSQQTPAASTRAATRTLNRAAPTTGSTAIANTRTRSQTLQSPRVRSNSRATAPSSRVWTAPGNRTQPKRPAVSVPTRTAQPRTVTRAAPTTSSRTIVRQAPARSPISRSAVSTPHSRVRPSRPANISSAPQRAAPARTPTRSVSTPSPSVRSAPPARTAPSVSRAPQRAPSYTPAPSTRRSAPAAPRSAPRSAPPGRSGDRPGSRSR